jgi:hypothetical protein
MAASTGKRGIGVTFAIGNAASPEVFAVVANVESINWSGREAEEVEKTHLGSTSGYREFLQGFKDPGTIELVLHFDPGHASQANSGVGILALFNSGDEFNFELDFADAGFAYKWSAAGYVQGDNLTIEPDAVMTRPVTIRVTGVMTQAASS